MAEKFKFEIVTPYGVVVSEEVDDATAPGAEGEFGVLKLHTDYLTTLKSGVVRYRKDGQSASYVVGRGYAEVVAEKTVIIVDSAEKPEDIDPEEARKALKDAEEALKGIPEDVENYKLLVADLELAKARVDALGDNSEKH
ncbi:MAG: F0F1 ATP synthase subunit epsilon [Deltaproteobacteria bacterium]|nr:F0F1 ATP synthase subunit epsilon [Deltaproteobacteria bacterium]